MHTHEVTNQPPALVNYNLYATDRTLMAAVRREGAEWAVDEISQFGARVGSQEVIDWGFRANECPPVLKTHDRFGNRIDIVEFHPAWHSLMQLALENGLHCSTWVKPRKGSHVARAARYYLMGQIEQGHACPVTMTHAILASLRQQPDIAKEWEPLITSKVYDPSFQPAGKKRGVTCGMGMTEKQGGSDVQANTTRARPAGKGGPGEGYLLTGHKWFCSAPMCDAFLVLARTEKGLSCFFLPRWRPDGTQNHFFIQRLKNKLGNRSNASSEVEFEDTWALLVGEEGRGVPTIIRMVNYTRLDCVIGSAATMRAAVAQALHHTTYRSAFGDTLINQPLMKNVLADLCVESDAACVLSMRLARAYDEAPHDAQAESFKRLATAIAKYWVCKRAPGHVYEALECLGGNGYVEESILPRLYRDAPLNSIWEGSGNVNCLDVLRAMRHSKETGAALFEEIALAKGGNRFLDAAIGKLKDDLADGAADESQARRFVEQMVLALQASLMVRHAEAPIADAFCTSRLGGNWGTVFGTLPSGADCAAIIRHCSLT